MSNMLTPQDLKNNGALHATVQDIYFDYSEDEEQKWVVSFSSRMADVTYHATL